MYVMKITIIYINEKLLFFVGCRFDGLRKKEWSPLKLHTKGFLFVYFLSAIHRNTMINDSNSYHFLVDVHYENYRNYHQTKKYYCLLVSDLMNKEKEG